MKTIIILILLSIGMTNLSLAQSSTTDIDRPEVQRFIGHWEGSNGEYTLRIGLIEGWVKYPGNSQRVKILEGSHSLRKNGVELENSFNYWPPQITIRLMYKEDPSLSVVNPNVINGFFSEISANKNLTMKITKDGDNLLVSFGDVVQGIQATKKNSSGRPVLSNRTFMLKKFVPTK